MEQTHLSVETWALWLSGSLPHEDVLTRIVPHLLAHCPSCRIAYEEVLRYQREFDHWDERVAVFEGQEAPELFAELEPWPFEQQLERVRNEERFQTWGLCQLLLKKSLEAGFEEPSKAVAFADLGVLISNLLVEEAYDPNWLEDLRVHALAHLGNALRILGEHWSAETAFRKAEHHLKSSTTGNPRVLGELLHFRASLLCDQRRFAEGIELVERAIALFRELGDDHRVGRCLVQKAKLREEVGDLDEAIRTLQEASRLVEAEREPRLILCVRQNLLVLLTAVGRLEEAEALLPETRVLNETLGNPLDQLRLRWTEACIEAGHGHIESAEATLREVQHEFFARRMGYDAALVSLDLAILYVRQGRTAELKRLAVEIMPAFESREVHREAMAALIMFQHAAEEEKLTVKLAQHLAAFLYRERRSGGIR